MRWLPASIARWMAGVVLRHLESKIHPEDFDQELSRRIDAARILWEGFAEDKCN